MTSSNGNIFRVTGPLCGEFTGPGEFPTQRPVTRSFGVFFDLCPNKRLSKQPWGWWFETPSLSLWRQCNVLWYNEVVTQWILSNISRYRQSYRSPMPYFGKSKSDLSDALQWCIKYRVISKLLYNGTQLHLQARWPVWSISLSAQISTKRRR